MSPESAELTKYVANALLATKISFINQMANVCEKFHADINDVRRGIGHDSRIGFAFLFPGVGYGGSCFPKDVRAMISTFRQSGIEPRILEAVDWVNEQQKTVMHDKIGQYFGDLKGKTIAIWGLAFKPRTDDIREAPALVLIDYLLKKRGPRRCARSRGHGKCCRPVPGRVKMRPQTMDTLDGADALAIMTEWSEFRTPDFEEMKQRMRSPVIFDGRNLFDPEILREVGFTYYSIGRPPVLA